MGLWPLAGEWDGYEWFRLADVPARPRRKAPARATRTRSAKGAANGAAKTSATAVDPAVSAESAEDDAGAAMGRWMVDRLDDEPLWLAGDSERVLLVDLDNLRAAPSRLRARLAVVVSLARQADHAAFAGQTGAVRRSLPWLAEFADLAQTVPDDLAAHALLARAAELAGPPQQFVVVSNDGIFVELADRGPLALLSPGADAMSDRLSDSAHRVVDLAALEKQAAAARTRSQRAARRRQNLQRAG
jgi:hypothetical protein